MLSVPRFSGHQESDGSINLLSDQESECLESKHETPSDYMPTSKAHRIQKFLLDALIAIIPVLFIALGITAYRLDGQAVVGSVSGPRVEQFAKVGATVFPIIFAATASRSLRVIARFRAEKGSKLGVLEMLLASRSVWSTVDSQLAIRRLTLVGAVLIAFWAFSPIGGQASLRLVTIHDIKTESPAKIRYFDTGPAAGIWPNTGLGGPISLHNFIESSLLFSCLLSSDQIKVSPRDTWNNLKIPRLEALNESAVDENGFIDICLEVSHSHKRKGIFLGSSDSAAFQSQTAKKSNRTVGRLKLTALSSVSL
ncbi:MAG: hypothetical protein M1822_001221 [Bathelium mastoideum]|nr:MAG: hypothetical protein M1822_001221 [Bathelium mastoideum]